MNSITGSGLKKWCKLGEVRPNPRVRRSFKRRRIKLLKINKIFINEFSLIIMDYLSSEFP